MPENPQPSASLLDRARKIRLFLMDVDGTLTDGGVCLISPPGGGEILEMKVFNAKDGAGLTLAHIMGIKTGFITGRKSPAVQQRAHEVHVDYVYLGQATKKAAFEECMQKAGVTEEETAYMGDDLPDLPIAQVRERLRGDVGLRGSDYVVHVPRLLDYANVVEFCAVPIIHHH